MLAVQDVSVNSLTNALFFCIAAKQIFLGQAFTYTLVGPMICSARWLHCWGICQFTPHLLALSLFLMTVLPCLTLYLFATCGETLQSTGMDTMNFNGHSFRIGAATAAAQAGLSDALIKTLGRWKSSAYATYSHLGSPGASSGADLAVTTIYSVVLFSLTVVSQ